jgi:hypothetical protein
MLHAESIGHVEYKKIKQHDFESVAKRQNAQCASPTALRKRDGNWLP